MSNVGVVAAAFVGCVALFALRRTSFVSEATAHRLLAKGALVIDFRSPEEFRSGQVARAVNIPLEELRDSLPCRVEEKKPGTVAAMASGHESDLNAQDAGGLDSL